MICYNCGGTLKKIITDLPFKIDHHSIIIIKKLPVLQCQNCHEYLIEDPVMETIDILLQETNKNVELEVLNYAA